MQRCVNSLIFDSSFKQKEIMKTLTLTYNKSEFATRLDFYLANGFDRDQFDNKYKKRIIIYTKDNVDYIESKVESDTEGNVTIKLTEYNA